MKIPRPFKSAFGAIQDFFSNIIIGGLVLVVLNKIDTVMDTLKNVYKTMKNVITKIGDFLKPVWRAMKWMVEGFSPSGLDLVNGILANKNTQDLMDLDKMKGLVDESTRFAKEISEIETESRKFGSEFKNIQQQFLSSSNEVETSMNDISPPPPLPQEQYTIPTLVPLLKSVGATDDEAVRLAAIGMHESSGNPNARNTTYPDNSYGLFQVNAVDHTLSTGGWDTKISGVLRVDMDSLIKAAKAAGKYEEGDSAEINMNYDSAKTMNVLQFKQNAQKDDKAKESTKE